MFTLHTHWSKKLSYSFSCIFVAMLQLITNTQLCDAFRDSVCVYLHVCVCVGWTEAVESGGLSESEGRAVVWSAGEHGSEVIASDGRQ